MVNYQKIDLFKYMNNFILVVKQKIFVNMLLEHLIVIIMELVCFIYYYYYYYVIDKTIFIILVDFTEFMLAIALTQSGDLDERLALAFDMYDYNHTGTSKLKIYKRQINCFVF